ncbi:MAG: hypothetical protein ACK4LB_01970 [Spirosomataceae bacterium]
MPLSDIHSPAILPPPILDTYLAHGWFRMGQQLFTTQFLYFDDQFYSAFWLRIELPRWSPSKSQEHILKRVYQRFQVSIELYQYNQEDDALFEEYRKSIPFEHSHSIQQLLYGNAEFQIFQTYSIRIWEGDKLIGLGFFDEGRQSMAGISCLYHPDYRKYSLGKFMMLQKMIRAKEQGKRFFYPGYCAPGYPVFDYKLDLAPNATFFYKITSQRWNKWQDKLTLPIGVIKKRLAQLSEILSEHGVAHSIQAYPYYDTNTAAHLRRFNLLDQPYFIALHSTQTHQFPIVYFDFLQGCFQLRKAQKFFTLNTEQATPPQTFTEALLKAHIVFLVHPDPMVMTNYILQNIRFTLDRFEFLSMGFLDKGE